MSLPVRQQRVLERMEDGLRAAGVASRAAVNTYDDLVFPPSAGPSPVPGDTSGMCYK